MSEVCDDPLARVRARLGEQLWLSDWIVVDQPRIDEFARATGDHYWLHTDPERARRDSPLGGTIAHGFLTMSLLAPSCLDALLGELGASELLNYGMDGLRFLAPVPGGARVRCRIALRSAVNKAG
ncbi:MAG: MaoC family dehydratase, partial [Sphingomonadaceae bacterium]